MKVRVQGFEVVQSNGLKFTHFLDQKLAVETADLIGGYVRPVIVRDETIQTGDDEIDAMINEPLLAVNQKGYFFEVAKPAKAKAGKKNEVYESKWDLHAHGVSCSSPKSAVLPKPKKLGMAGFVDMRAKNIPNSKELNTTLEEIESRRALRFKRTVSKLVKKGYGKSIAKAIARKGLK